MKISKINHTKSAVAKNYGNIEGVLYKDPNNSKYRYIKLDKHLKDANKNAKRLFNVFNSIQKETEKNKSCKDFIDKKGNRIIKDIFFDENRNIIEKYDLIKNNIKEHKKLEENNFDICEKCIQLYLRKDLINQKENLKIFFRCLGNSNINDGDLKKLEKLHQAIIECYTKKKKFENIKKSIENHNMLVQPQNGVIKLSRPSIKESENIKLSVNQIEKKALSDFIDLYADINEENRTKYLKQLMRLIELYFLGCDKELLNESSFSTSILFNDFDILKKINEWKDEKKTLINIEKYKNINKDDDVDLCNVELKDEVKKQNADLYRKTKECLSNEKLCVFENKDINLFWIHHIENAIEKTLSKINVHSLYKLNYSYLKEKVRKDITNYISTKYIGIGKAVYQFGMNDLNEVKDEIKLGNLKDSIIEGITSFDYEIIKAEETLQRELAVSVAFAANNLSKATVDIETAIKETKIDNNTDFLLWNEKTTEKYLLNNTVRNVLQFFGGYSVRRDMKEVISSYYGSDNNYEAKLVTNLKNFIYSLRNETMHFSTLDNGDSDLAHELAKDMFVMDARFCSRAEIEKYCNVGLNLFYSDEKIKKLIIKIYEKQSDRASQVPSFNTLFSRKKFAEFLKNEFKLKPDIIDPKDDEKWLNALYYTFKEIYYNAFLQSEEKIKKYFDDALKKEYEALKKEYDNSEKESDRKVKKDSKLSATNNFKNRYDEIKKGSFAEICQLFLSEYNTQNVSRKKKSTQEKKNNPEIYRHYVDILHNMIKLSFKEFILKEEYTRFLIDDAKDKLFVENIRHENIEPKNFLPDVTLSLYDGLVKAFNEEPYLHKWYIMSRFLDGKTLNEFIGSLRSYVQYVSDVIRRSGNCGNKVKYQDSILQNNKQIIRVVDMCTNLCSIYSNNIDDYFDDYDDYKEFLANYISEDCISDEIYFDEKNAIANRNIIEAKLFGPTSVLKNVLKDNKITVEDIDDYKERKNHIEELSRKEDKIRKDQEDINSYQNIKNFIELRNLVDYGKLINDLFGQLINWSYLRERDLFYFQLGFHYTCLNNNTNKPVNGYKEVMVGDYHIVNPILWQIASMYIYGVAPIKKENDNWAFDKENLSTGAKIGKFINYTKNLGYEEEYLYNAGLEVFEVISEHEDIIRLRNSIDHFHYYYNNELSILDYYSIVFDKFFTYDVKYRKNVINLLSNILLRYKVIAKKINFKTKEENSSNNQSKKRAQIDISGNLYSEKAIYKLSDKDEKIDIKSTRYINDINNILNYSNKK